MHATLMTTSNSVVSFALETGKAVTTACHPQARPACGHLHDQPWRSCRCWQADHPYGRQLFSLLVWMIYRCDCPNHETVNASWPGYPSLPPQGYINNYGVRMTGQFLVERPSSGVIGETPAIYPTASDYHLICLQHDDSAQMIVDGVSYYESESPVASIAGYKQYCEPIELAPGYHNLELRYGKSPLSTSSTFKFFVINAEQVTAPQHTPYTLSNASTLPVWTV